MFEFEVERSSYKSRGVQRIKRVLDKIQSGHFGGEPSFKDIFTHIHYVGQNHGISRSAMVSRRAIIDQRV
jgi:hypothetical protein